MVSLLTPRINFYWYRIFHLSSYLVLFSLRHKFLKINSLSSINTSGVSLSQWQIQWLPIKKKKFKNFRKFLKRDGLYWVMQIHPIFVKNVKVSITEFLINFLIEFVFGKLFELLRVYEECFRDFHRSCLRYYQKGFKSLYKWREIVIF
jgi:hypothetical protein